MAGPVPPQWCDGGRAGDRIRDDEAGDAEDLLDEPTTFLDIAYQIELLELFTDLNLDGHTLVAVLHDLNQAARYATHLIAMKDGRVVAEGAPREIVTADLVEQVFGVPCLVVPDPVTGAPSIAPLGRDRSGHRSS